MKKINKQESPHWFEDWKRNFKIANNRDAHYKNDFSTDDADGANRRQRLKESLINEQGKICCYCMRRISINSSHIEHFSRKRLLQIKIYLMKNLERDRRQAIEASEVFDNEEYSEEEIRDFIDYYSNKDNGVYVPYCKAIIDCLKEML